MNEQRIEELKNALRDIVAMVTQRGQPLTPDLKLMLAQVMEHVASRIQQLRTETPEELPEELPTQVERSTANLTMQRDMPSSNIHSFAYDDDSGKLYVRFQDKWPNQNGPVYEYGGIPKAVYELFRAGAIPAKTNGQNKWGRWWTGKKPSLGASMAALIKNGGYPYQRLS